MKKHIFLTTFVLFGLVLAIKLFFLQVVSPEYKIEAQGNVKKRIVEHPVRGIITDRSGKLIVSNTPVFNIYIVPKELKIADTAYFCKVFEMSMEEVREKVHRARKHSRHQPYLFLKDISTSTYARIQDRLIEFPGMYAEARTVREYPHQSLANALGYVNEVDKKILERDTAGYYRQGDLIGRSGIEASYEHILRGQRGTRYVMVDVRQVVKGSFMNGIFDTLPEIGKSLISSVDLDLQNYGEKLMRNKIGSIVAIEPSTGEILAMISAPSYDPNMLAGGGREIAGNFARLVRDEHKPLYNRTLMSPYPPGSIIKLVQALIGLQEGVIDSTTTSIPCVQNVVKCHNHPSPLNVKGSVQHSCNPFYYRVFNRIITQGESRNYSEDTRIGLDKWRAYMLRFGLGEPLGTDLPGEKGGNIPSSAYYDKRFKTNKWKFGNIYSLSIGQGEMGVIPIQMANIAAIMANRGYFYTPHIIKGVGEPGNIAPEFKTRRDTGIKREYFELIVDGMEKVVSAGTARRAYLSDLSICGKTGTAQNPHGDDHSVFIGFAPKHNPKIAIAVYVENAGFGGTWAAPIASLMMEKYIKGEISRQRLEEEIFNKDLISSPKGRKAPVQKGTQNNDTKIAETRERLLQISEVSTPAAMTIPLRINEDKE